MKILHINTYDVWGAAKACLRLHNGLMTKGIESKVLLKIKTHEEIPSTYTNNSSTPNSIENYLSNKISYLIKKNTLNSQAKEREKLTPLRKNLEWFSFPVSEIDITTSKEYQEADIIHLHWVANFLDWKSFFHKNKKPIVWTLHDQNPFLGIEHYAERFLGIDNFGVPLKREISVFEKQTELKWLNYKQNILKEVLNVTIVSPSFWLKYESERSKLFNRFEHIHIPNGFPSNIFKPINQAFSREVLGLPQQKKIILFVADSVTSNRKGLAFLIQAIEKINDSEFILCAIGAPNFTFSNNNFISLGKISDERLMAMAYSAADVFVIPSLEDNFPNTVIESLLCGTPVVAFPTGGITDAVKSRENGVISTNISVASLKNALEEFFINYQSFDRSKISAAASNNYNLNLQAKRYIELYEKILTKNSPL